MTSKQSNITKNTNNPISAKSSKQSMSKPSLDISRISQEKNTPINLLHNHNKPNVQSNSFYGRYEDSIKKKSIKNEMATILSIMETEKECTFNPKINATKLQLSSSFMEREINSLYQKDTSIEEIKYQQKLTKSKQYTFHPKILKISHKIAKNYVPLHERRSNKKELSESPKNVLVSRSNSSSNSLYNDAVRRATMKKMMMSDTIDHITHISSNTNKIFYSKIRDEINSKIQAYSGSANSLTFSQFSAIVNELGIKKNIYGIWNLSLCQNECLIQNLQMILYVIFGVIRNDEEWNCNQAKRAGKEGITLHRDRGRN